jgi:hypothetical protein
MKPLPRQQRRGVVCSGSRKPSASEDPEALESYAMAHREQHSNREAKKPKQEKPKGGATAQPQKWAVSEALQAKDTSKH